MSRIVMGLEFKGGTSHHSLWRWVLAHDAGERFQDGGWVHDREQALHDGSRAAVRKVQEGVADGWILGVDRQVPPRDRDD